MDTWEDKQTGQKRSRLKVIGEAFQFLGGKEDGSSPAGTPSTQEFAPPGGGGYRTERPSGGRPQPSGGSGYRSEEPHPASPPPDFGHEEEDDIPF